VTTSATMSAVQWQCGWHCACCKIQPSMLASDFASLKSEAKSVLDGGADELHLDVMDGGFVPNISFGAPVIASLHKSLPDAFLDCHMMVSKPSQWITDIAKAGGSRYTFHLEAIKSDELDLAGVCSAIRAAGMQVGVGIKPGTEVEALADVIAIVDMVLVMTVEPGFGGQSFMPNMMPKVLSLRTAHPKLDIQVDGGLSPKTVDAAAAAGANFIVAGSAVFKPGVDPKEPISVMRRSVERLGHGKADEPPVAAAAALSPQDMLKRDAGYKSIDAHVRSGMVVGLGTGSTAYFAVERLGMKLTSGELSRVVAIPTSVRTAEQARSLSIPLSTLDDHPALDVAIDGADAVDPALNCVKGGGGALLREKMVAARAAKFILIVDESKLCEGLGPSFDLPVEITPFCHKCTLRTIAALPELEGCEARLRLGSSTNNKIDGTEPAVTDNGNYIVDLSFVTPMADAVAAGEALKRVVGVVDHGLFCSMAAEAIVAAPGGVYTLTAGS